LLVDQTLQHIREDGMMPGDAIVEATRNRIRPIFMSTLTSVIGMLPLVLAPGAGSELYRGLGAVVIGGLGLSSVMTLAVVPPLMGLVVAPLERRAGRIKAEEQAPLTSVAQAPAE
jgi:HAE1 family hydrophobic/amphiphilic exporter-1